MIHTTSSPKATVSIQPLQVQGFTYEDRTSMLPTVSAAILRSGGWVHRRRVTSPNSIQLQIELQPRSLIDVYAGLLSSGLELTRSAHLALTESCSCHQQMPHRAGTLATIHLAISFLDDLEDEIAPLPTHMA